MNWCFSLFDQQQQQQQNKQNVEEKKTAENFYFNLNKVAK